MPGSRKSLFILHLGLYTDVPKYLQHAGLIKYLQPYLTRYLIVNGCIAQYYTLFVIHTITVTS